MFHELIIPKSRVPPVLKIKSDLEKRTKTTISIQREGDVDISGDLESVLIAENIIKVARESDYKKQK